MLGLTLGVTLAAAADVPPEAPAEAPPEAPPPEEAPTGSEARPFGMEVSAGYGAQSLLGAWPDPGVAGVWRARVGLYPKPVDQGGPRVGASVWAEGSAAPRQTATELWDDLPETFAFSTTHFGLDVSMRADPAAPWSATVDFGFGRLDLVDYFDGPMTIPTFNARLGARRALRPAFVELGARVGWGAARDDSGALGDWWVVGADVGVGLYPR